MLKKPKSFDVTKSQLYFLNLFYTKTHNVILPLSFNYFIGRRNNLFIFNLVHALIILKRSYFFFCNVYKKHGNVLVAYDDLFLWNTLKYSLQKCPIPFINNKWINGTLSNFKKVYEQILIRLFFYSNHPQFLELLYNNKKVNFLFSYFYNLRYIKYTPSSVFILSTDRLYNCLQESQKINIVSVGCVNPLTRSTLDYSIPLNDGTKLSTFFYLTLVKQSFYTSISKKYFFLNKILKKNIFFPFKLLNLGVYLRNHLVKHYRYFLIKKRQLVKHFVNNNSLFKNNIKLYTLNKSNIFSEFIIPLRKKVLSFSYYDNKRLNDNVYTFFNDKLLTEKVGLIISKNNKYGKFDKKYLITHKKKNFQINFNKALKAFKFISLNKKFLPNLYRFLIKLSLLDSFVFFKINFFIFETTLKKKKIFSFFKQDEKKLINLLILLFNLNIINTYNKQKL